MTVVKILPVVLALAFARSATDQTTRGTLPTKEAASPFLTRLPTVFLIPPDDPRLPPWCREARTHSECPAFLAYGGAAGNPLPTIDPPLKADLPHVRVTFVVQRISNDIVANGGLDLGISPWPWVWQTSSSAASVETAGSSFILPKPGEPPWTDENVYLIRLYDALVFNACQAFTGFPVDHRTSIREDGVEIAAFHGVDASTLDATGFYNFQFTVRAGDAEGRISDFHFSGKVSVTCSGLTSLP